MNPMAEQEKFVLDGRTYDASRLNEETKMQFLSLRSAEQEISRLQNRLAIAQTARKTYANELQTELKKLDVSP